MSTQSKFQTARPVLKRTGLLATMTIATAMNFMNAPVQAQSAKKLASEAEITVVSARTPIPARASFNVQANCPPNTIAIGGGGELMLPPAYGFLSANAPILSNAKLPNDRIPMGWKFTGNSNASVNTTATVYAICAQLSKPTIAQDLTGGGYDSSLLLLSGVGGSLAIVVTAIVTYRRRR